MRQAQRMQRRIDEVRAQVKDQEKTGAAAGDKVTVTVTCEGKLTRVTVDPAFLASEGLELTLDAIVAAANAALDTADKHVEAEIAKVTGGIKVPGLGG